MKKGMKLRIVLGAAMIAATVGLLYGDWWLEHADAELAAGLPLGVVMVALTVVGYFELARLAGALGVRMAVFAGPLGAAALAALPVWQQILPDSAGGFLPLLVLAVTTAAVFLEQMLSARIEDGFRRIAATLLAVVYLGAGGAMILAVRTTFGVPALAMFLMAVKGTDIGAYFTGSAIGRHKMIPWLSPGKSWEGLVGGVVFAAAVSALCAWGFRLGELLTPWQALGFGAVVALVGQFGDLCESLLKRSAAAKDSGSLVPEFGGLLDILDSPLLAAPAAYLVLLALS
ncbi:MAG TPA: hypothetical protein DCX07_11145 [Phycisphaerales bacterium]|nr:hypothetical protein [Phycisphaerales bacterium]